MFAVLKAIWGFITGLFGDPDAVYTDEQKIRDIYYSIRNENKD
jgi:hypothetical protein